MYSLSTFPEEEISNVHKDAINEAWINRWKFGVNRRPDVTPLSRSNVTFSTPLHVRFPFLGITLEFPAYFSRGFRRPLRSMKSVYRRVFRSTILSTTNINVHFRKWNEPLFDSTARRPAFYLSRNVYVRILRTVRRNENTRKNKRKLYRGLETVWGPTLSDESTPERTIPRNIFTDRCARSSGVYNLRSLCTVACIFDRGQYYERLSRAPG